MNKLPLLIMNLLAMFIFGACQSPQRPSQQNANESKQKIQEIPSNITFFGGGRSKKNEYGIRQNRHDLYFSPSGGFGTYQTNNTQGYC